MHRKDLLGETRMVFQLLKKSATATIHPLFSIEGDFPIDETVVKVVPPLANCGGFQSQHYFAK